MSILKFKRRLRIIFANAVFQYTGSYKPGSSNIWTFHYLGSLAQIGERNCPPRTQKHSGIVPNNKETLDAHSADLDGDRVCASLQAHQ
jgi:hypothetical protein